MIDKLHPEDVGPLGRVGNDPIRKAATYAHLERLERLRERAEYRRMSIVDDLRREAAERQAEEDA